MHRLPHRVLAVWVAAVTIAVAALVGVAVAFAAGGGPWDATPGAAGPDETPATTATPTSTATLQGATSPLTDVGLDAKTALRTPFTQQATFTDDGGAHTCRFWWASVSPHERPVIQDAFGTAGTCSDTHAYGAAGGYIVGACVWDASEEVGCDQFNLRVNSGPVTGTVPPDIESQTNCRLSAGTFGGRSDRDCDTLSDGAERWLQPLFPCLSPTDWDGDDDRLADGHELLWRTDICEADTDGDGVPDGKEILRQTASGWPCLQPRDRDSDGDGLSDGAEGLSLTTNPCKTDADGDGLKDGLEWFVTNALGHGSQPWCPDPRNPDSDNDSRSDGAEVVLGRDFCDPDG